VLLQRWHGRLWHEHCSAQLLMIDDQAVALGRKPVVVDDLRSNNVNRIVAWPQALVQACLDVEVWVLVGLSRRGLGLVAGGLVWVGRV
jgi:hypothetical protein